MTKQSLLTQAVTGTPEWVKLIIIEIREAQQEWENANRFFNFALGKDQVDYAIHAIIAAEKRYAMLLRLAKNAAVQWPKWEGTEL